MKIPFLYNLRSVLQRPYSTALTALGIALVVAVFIGMLALANGFRAALAKTGSNANVIVLRRGADSELSSGLPRETASMIAASPHVATGAVNTMYAAISARSPEIAVLMTLGFRPFSVLTSFLVEAAIIAAVGGLVGCLIAIPINGLVTSTTNWASFSEIAFSFRITPLLLLIGFLFAVVMGIIGGFFPAWRAARLRVIQALR